MCVPVALQTKSKGDQERRKGIPWTEDEHRLFLLGLQKYGKGDWRSISRNFVISRTPTQARFLPLIAWTSSCASRQLVWLCAPTPPQHAPDGVYGCVQKQSGQVANACKLNMR